MTAERAKAGVRDSPAQAELMLQRIGRAALQSNLARVSRLDEALRAAAAGSLATEECRTAASVAHQLVGSAGTFGHPRVSELARELETLFSRPPGPDTRAVDAALAHVQVMQELLQGRIGSDEP